ncbi:MAG: bifunctional precorrin-2 dehydrogenase/sirohydrochlorin ferrochelatase [Sedimentisphaerales bacterium]|nr:bifunctional precorrin-2 dehydrogenase/sirohydrochlorin ferrochelatase [Sedimentisphaerales bacterium]
MHRYPIYLNLAGKRTIVIGAGTVGARKVLSLADAGARVVVVALHFDSVFAESCNLPNVELIESAYSKDYLASALLCIAATNDPTLNQRIYRDCQELEVLCNVVDVPELCDFYVPAVVQRGPLQIAVSTDGHCPAYAGHVRRKLETLFTETHGRFVEALEQMRREIIQSVDNPNHRKALLGELVKDESLNRFLKEGPDAWFQYAESLIEGK